MALNKQFIHFQTKSAFNKQKENISDTSIAFIKETGEIYTHDKLYGSISVASTTANGLMPKEHYSIIDKESNNQFVTELSNNVSTTADKVYIQYKSRYFGDDLKHDNICNILSATSTNAGVMSATDKRKLDSLSNYTLPTANSSTLGGIKIGSGLNIDSNGTVSVNNKLYILVNSLESVTTPDANKIYLVLNSSSTSETNSFTEYVWITSDTGGKWEKLGEFKTDVDLTPYAKTADVTSAINAVRESVATHEQILDKHHQVLNSISETKVEWFVIPITAAVYEDILSGVKDYITIPYDISLLIEGDERLKTGQAGIKLEVADGASVNAVYLPFTLVSQTYILPSFDDLVIRGTSLSSGKAYDTRYHVNVDAKTNYIKLEKAGAAELPWLDLSPADDEELKNFMNAFALAGQTGEAQEYALTAHEAVDITKYRGIVIDIASEGIHFKTPFVVSDGTYRICAETFIANSECVLACKCADSKLWLTLINISLRDMFQYQSTFAKTSDLSDYAKKTDIRYPWLEIDMQDDLYNGIANLNPGERFELVPQSTGINPNEDLSKYCGLRLHDTYDNVWYLPWAYILDDRSEYDTCPFMFNGKTLRAEVIGASVWFINNDPDLSDYAKKTDVYTKAEVDAKLTGMVKIQKLTQEEYDALKTKDENVLYAIIEPATEG